jgi:hypothetical protein
MVARREEGEASERGMTSVGDWRYWKRSGDRERGDVYDSPLVLLEGWGEGSTE